MTIAQAEALKEAGFCPLSTVEEVCQRDWNELLEKFRPLDKNPRTAKIGPALQKLINKGFTLPPKTMDEFKNWMDEMTRTAGTPATPEDAKPVPDPAPAGELREVKYNKPGTPQSMFNPASKPQQSEAQQKATDKNGEDRMEVLQNRLKQIQDKSKQGEGKPTPDAQPQPAPTPPPTPESAKSPLELQMEKILQQEAEAAQQKSQLLQQMAKQQAQPQHNPEALKDLTQRVEVLEELAETHDGTIAQHNQQFTDLTGRVEIIEANYVGQATFQDWTDTFDEKLAQVLTPKLIQIGDRPEVKLNKRTHVAFEEVLFLAQTFQQVYLVGPAGSGKTSLAEDVATAMGLNFGFISCSAGMAEAHLLGRMIVNGSYLPARFVELYENGGLFLFDEVDAADANTMLVLNSALANGYLSVPNRQDNPVARRHADFVCLVAANTLGTGSFEYHGRNYLDAAFLDRFAISRHQVEYDIELEREMLAGDAEMARVLHRIRKNLEDTRTRRVVSTRAFISTTKLLLGGKEPQYVVDKLMLGWTEEEKTKAKKDVVVPKRSPLKDIGEKQREREKTKRDQAAADLKRAQKQNAQSKALDIKDRKPTTELVPA